MEQTNSYQRRVAGKAPSPAACRGWVFFFLFADQRRRSRWLQAQTHLDTKRLRSLDTLCVPRLIECKVTQTTLISPL